MSLHAPQLGWSFALHFYAVFCHFICSYLAFIFGKRIPGGLILDGGLTFL